MRTSWVSFELSPPLFLFVLMKGFQLHRGYQQQWPRTHSRGWLTTTQENKQASNIFQQLLTNLTFYSEFQKDTVSTDIKDDEIDADENSWESWSSMSHDSIVHDGIPFFPSQDLGKTTSIRIWSITRKYYLVDIYWKVFSLFCFALFSFNFTSLS